MKAAAEPDPALVSAAQAALDSYEGDVQAALERRDAELRRIKEQHGCTQADLVRATGLSRETVRQILNPEARAAARASLARRRAASQEAP
jgi:uncharacterized membrane protein